MRRGRAQQIGRPPTLRPERCALARPLARQEQRARGILAKASAEQRALAETFEQQLVHSVRVRHQQSEVFERCGLGESKHDPVVRPDGVRLDAKHAPVELHAGEGPGCVHAGAERRQQAHTKIADFVGKLLDHELAVGRHVSARLALLCQVLPQIARRARVEPDRFESRRGLGVWQRSQLAAQLADGLAELERAPALLASPERHAPRLAWGGRHQHAVEGDVGDPPRARAEQEHLAHARLVDHFLVEFTDADALALGRVRQEHAEQSAVRDRSAVDDRDVARTLSRRDSPRDPIPDQSRLELGEVGRRVTPRQQIEH